jgi:hypothetical protein
MRRIEERNENIWALARSNKGGPRIMRNLALMNDRSIKASQYCSSTARPTGNCSVGSSACTELVLLATAGKAVVE